MSSLSVVCPLEWRYGSDEMRRIFSVENVVSKYVEVERALVCALEELGIAERGSCEKISVCSVDPREVYELERRTGHDIASLVMILERKTGCRFVHFGATSYDIVDTAWALIVRDALRVIRSKLIRVIDKLIEYSLRYRDLVMMGRTHGQHALPITLGFKFANYVYELSRGLKMLIEMEDLVVRGKLSGAVGTMASWGKLGLEVERRALSKLVLRPHEISTQVAPRDGFAYLVLTLSVIACQLDRLALEIRELSRTEINELIEGPVERVGSSAMPHKVNPVTCEKISGLAKVMRGLVVTALENIPLWHERDLTNSSSERILVPHAFLILDEMLESTMKVLENLYVNESAIRRNLELMRGYVLTEAVMNKLILKGLSREEAHRLLRELTRECSDKMSLWDALRSSEKIRAYLSEDEISEIRYESYLGCYRELIDRAISYAKSIIEEAIRHA